jgi:hypothetical protein
MKLEKATIAELEGKTPKNRFDVQFNPTSLHLALTNQPEGGQTHGKQVRQQLGASSTTLTLDLIFDTADEGTTENPVSVRNKTKQIERFLIPKGSGKESNAPPRIQFSWGDLVVEGIVETLTIDFDHFAANGVPLRAKVPLSIKGQDTKLELTKQKDERQGAPLARDTSPARPGSDPPSGAPPNSATALAGESAGEFAARVGLDPAAWRGLQLGGESSLSLSAGVEVGFDASLSASAGLGVTLGVEAGASVSLEASFGLEANAGINAVAGIGAGADLAAGFALSSAGGVSAALESVSAAKSQAAEQQARAAFKAPEKSLPPAGSQAKQTSSAPATTTVVSATGAQPKPPAQKHTPLKSSGLPTVSAQQDAPAAPRVPRADPRSSSFGFGVPLRSTVGEAADRRAGSIRGDVAVKSKTISGDPPSTSDPTTPPWVALPSSNLSRQAADKTQRRFRPARPCGCSGCKH